MLTIIGVAIMMFWVSPLLAVISMLIIPVSGVVSAMIGKRAQTRFKAMWAETGKLNAQVEESYTGHALVKVFGRKNEVQADFDATNQRLYEASFSAQFISATIMPVNNFIGNLSYLVIAVLGGLRVASGQMALGDVQAFIQYSRMFTQPISQVASMSNLLQSGVASAERVYEVLDADERTPDGTGLLPEPLRGRVEFRNVDFSYTPEQHLIENLDLVAEPGQTVAIVGPTGAGKTTLVNLLERFYEIQGGKILIDGVDITTVPRAELRSQLGMVLQDSWLFGGTIRDNIAYGKPGATQEEIMAAATAAYVDRFVHTLPDGYDTVIDQDATNVSAGEKQRHDCPGVHRRTERVDPGRGNQLGGHPHRGAGAAGDGQAATEPHQFRDRAPVEHHPRRRPDSGDAAGRDRRAGHPRAADRGSRGLLRPVREPVRRPGLSWAG